MGISVSIAKAKAVFASLIARAEKGEEVTVTRHGRPVARIVPIKKQAPIKYGDLAHLRDPGADYSLETLTLPDDLIDEIERNLIDSIEPKRKGGEPSK
jgi:prevent-host-death family protein